MELVLVLAIPVVGAILLALVGAQQRAAELNVVISFATLIAAAALVLRIIGEGPMTVAHEQFFVDPFNVFLIALTALVGFTTAVFSRPYMRIEQDHGRLNARRLRLYHSMYQLFMTAMLVALSTNNMGLLWVAMEAATLSTVLLVSLYRTRASIEAAWKYFILCGVGIALALFGTILLYFAAERLLGSEGMSALLWTHLNAVKGQLDPAVIGLAFVFLLVGYGTKVGLAPLHNWLPDAHAEGPQRRDHVGAVARVERRAQQRRAVGQCGQDEFAGGQRLRPRQGDGRADRPGGDRRGPQRVRLVDAVVAVRVEVRSGIFRDQHCCQGYPCS